MDAIVIHAPRDLRIEPRDPGAPGPGQALVRIAVGGICGSDLHYYQHGGFGAVRLQEPMVLGHEVAGHVEAIGPGVETLAPGDLVAVNPSGPCGVCRFCTEGLRNHCLEMRFYGSAMRFPHVQGAFRRRLVVDAGRCEKAAPGVTPGAAAVAEPLAVCLHALAQAGGVAGKRVLVTGCGPIGALCVMAARQAGAAEIVVTDLSRRALDFAASVGADHTILVGEDLAALARFEADKGWFDVALEASGAAAAVAAALAVLRPRGMLVQLGLGGDMSIPMNMLVAKEIQLVGSFRFDAEFAEAMRLINTGAVDMTPLITATLPLSDAVAAFELAGDRSRAMKVQIAFD